MWLGGCGAGTPLLHPAHVLEAHQIRAGAGVSQYLAYGDVEGAIERSRNLGASETGVADSSREEFISGALAHAIATPDLAPWVGARAGLGSGNEMGLAYTGRRLRADLRHAFPLGDLAFSVGAGLGAILPNVGSRSPHTGAGSPDAVKDGSIPRFDGGRISGWTVDVPLLIGTRNRPELVSSWVGVHGLYERFSAELLFDFDANETPALAPTTGSRLFAGAVAGLAIGLRPLWVVLEVSGGYQNIRSEVNLGAEAYLPRLEGFALTPSFALMADLD